MLRFASILLFAILISCKQEVATDSNAMPADTIATASTPQKEGSGKVTLQCGPQTITVEGKCGGVTTTGEMIIAVQDKANSARVFTISFNTADYPENGKTYTIKKSDFMTEGKKPAGDIYIGFSEMTQQKQMDWSSDDHSGTMTFEVNGDTIKCSFKDIRLQPSMVYNKGDLNQQATVSGAITLYKK